MTNWRVLKLPVNQSKVRVRSRCSFTFLFALLIFEVYMTHSLSAWQVWVLYDSGYMTPHATATRKANISPISPTAQNNWSWIYQFNLRQACFARKNGGWQSFHVLIGAYEMPFCTCLSKCGYPSQEYCWPTPRCSIYCCNAYMVSFSQVCNVGGHVKPRWYQAAISSDRMSR